MTAMEYDFWTMRESPFHQLSDFQCIFLFAFGEVKIICAFVTFSADPTVTATIDPAARWHTLGIVLIFASQISVYHLDIIDERLFSAKH